MSDLSSIESLPNELISLIIGFLPSADLKDACLVSKAFYRHASDFLWHSVTLEDKWTLHTNDSTRHVFGDRGQGEPDEHDDTPIIEKLYILATNPALAKKVQVLTHRCHLPMPNIFSELPQQHFHSEVLSQDRRLHTILALAIANLVNVHTLRILYGHYNLTRILLGAFLDPRRPQRIHLRKLWLESCSLTNFETCFANAEYVTGLESIRVRRLRAESQDSPERSKMRFLSFRLCRGGHSRRVHNAAGGWLWTTVEHSSEEAPPRWTLPSLDELKANSDNYDKQIWENLPAAQFLCDVADPFEFKPMIPPLNPILFLLEKSAPTLTSLNLDWVLWRQDDLTGEEAALRDIQSLAQLRFPHLRAFQLRNAVVPETGLPEGIYLLEDTFLAFMEAHPRIQCLSWPLERFYSHNKPTPDLQRRTREVVSHLGNTLIDLRLDTYYCINGEKLTDESSLAYDQLERVRRRRFIFEFAPHMFKVEQLKLEGGIARDEKREIVRALHFSPLKKIVLIGVTFPVGNTWGRRGEQLKLLDPGQVTDAIAHLEEEDISSIMAAHKQGRTIHPNFQFTPSYGWKSSPSFLHTMAEHHASTIEELKLCGYNGSPILSHSTPVTNPLLWPLRSFENLRQLVISFWLLTYFENSYRDTEIIQSWMDTRSPSSTALVVMTPPASPTPPPPPPVDPAVMPIYDGPVSRPQEFNRWAVALKTKYTPSALAYRVAADIGPHLSPVAKARPGGVRVRASFCIGTREERRQANDIFDLDIRIGEGDRMIEFIGPREEAERGRFCEKLGARRWF
ncbi:hypothetical protein P280DRAFT_467499 [Massarina eburnea CBS 473.64]|uniref:F-box domain-containing protein n=1 Tax=Massarina eburnea CBS 473.64 TaxID=1395130 RepID=A0A6A6S8C4_9PLEO|nr:hypothetical protein P280DRAFT_467499 [Massarina eburnea CBS 473.64]